MEWMVSRASLPPLRVAAMPTHTGVAGNSKWPTTAVLLTSHCDWIFNTAFNAKRTALINSFRRLQEAVMPKRGFSFSANHGRFTIVTFAAATLLVGILLGTQNTRGQVHIPGSASPQPALTLNSSSWTPIGPAPIVNGERPGNGPVSGRIVGIAAHPTIANTIYVATAGGGVWKTTDGGTNWSPLTDSQSTLSMGAIAIAPSNPLMIYAGTGEPNSAHDSNFGRGVLVSTDGGATWTLRNNGGALDRTSISEIAVDPTNPNVAYVAVGYYTVNGLMGNTGIWKTTNGGVTWTNTTAAITSTLAWTSVRIDPNNPSILYAAIGDLFGSNQNGVYKSTNGGVNWSLLPGAPSGLSAGRIVIAVAKSNSQVVYVSASSAGSNFGDLYKMMRSDNGGATFTDLTPPTPPTTPNYMGGLGYYDTTLVVDPTNSAIVYAGGAGGVNSLIRSTNSGATWYDISATGFSSTGPHIHHHAAAFDAGGRYLDGDDGGIYRLDDPGPTSIVWSQLNGNLNTIQFQSIGLHPTDSNVALGGSQGNGTSRYTGSLSWALVEGADGGMVKFSKTMPSRVYHQAPISDVGAADFFRRSDDGGVTWASKVSGITGTNSLYQRLYFPFVVDPGNGNRILFGGLSLSETTDAGDTWHSIGGASFGNKVIESIGLSPSDPDTIYVSVAGGNTYVTSNHGVNWTQRNVPFTCPNLSPLSPVLMIWKWT
jgi:photosystem II stability/assembly factor-like uncharacterized protein